MSNLKKSGCDPLFFLNRAMNKWEKKNTLPEFSLREISIPETKKLISGLGNSTSYG